MLEIVSVLLLAVIVLLWKCLGMLRVIAEVLTTENPSAANTDKWKRRLERILVF